MEIRACTHFDLHTLGEGIYAAVHKPGGGAFSNAGIVDLGGRLLVFDTFETLAAARELARLLRELTGREPDWVVNSHAHADHWMGNQVFSGRAAILSTPRTRQAMLEWGEEKKKQQKEPEALDQEIRELERQLGREQNPEAAALLEASLIRRRLTRAELAEYRFVPPEQTFSGKLTFHGTARQAELVATGPGHTREECHLVLSAERIVFTGDLAFFDSPPFLPPDCDLDGWQAQLDSLAQMGMATYVPGHGNPGGSEGFPREKRYLQAMRALVREQVRRGMSLEELLGMPMPEEFSDWAGFRSRQANNLRTLFGQERKTNRAG